MIRGLIDTIYGEPSDWVLLTLTSRCSHTERIEMPRCSLNFPFLAVAKDDRAVAGRWTVLAVGIYWRRGAVGQCRLLRN
jgi:hypothetical protein